MPEAFKIQEAHLDAFRADRVGRFERRASAWLREMFPEATSAISDHALQGRVRSGVDRASPYGLTAERHVMAFLATTFLAGEHFDSDPDGWARSILDGRGLDSEDKAKLLLIAATSRVQASASASGKE